MTSLGGCVNEEQRQRLLRFVRDTASRLLGGPAFTTDVPRIEGTFGGAFVTFRCGERLRGCVGRFVQTSDLTGTLKEVTESALSDERFAADRITADELPALRIEVSILSDNVRTDSPTSLVPGVHGIIVKCGLKTGCFLPKVATDRGWGAEEFLSQCCVLKAGLPRDAWRDRATEIRLFTSESFEESHGAYDPPAALNEQGT